MQFLQTFIAFLVAIGLLVVVHELGHYLVARWCGVKVLRFSIGMGKVLYSRRFGKDQTEWAISLLPFGGYVQMLDAKDKGQDLSDLPPDELKREFNSQNVWRRIAIVIAGPASNFILAILVLTALYIYGIPGASTKLRAIPENSIAWQAGLRGGELVTAVNGEPVRIWSEFSWKVVQAAVDQIPVQLEVLRNDSAAPDGTKTAFLTIPVDSLSAKDLDKNFLRKIGIDLARPRAQLGQIVPDGPAMRAGLQEGDFIDSVNGQSVIDGLALVELVRASPDKPLRLSGVRGGQPFEATVTPEAHTDSAVTTGRIQAEVPLGVEMAVASDSMFVALHKAVIRTWDTSVLSVKMIGKMVVGEVSWKNISGPITIADYAGKTSRIGPVSYLSFIAFISISLGVMNLLPIPVLDGGLLLYYSMEIVSGRPISERAGMIAQRAGLAMLVSLMLVAVFNDIARLLL